MIRAALHNPTDVPQKPDFRKVNPMYTEHQLVSRVKYDQLVNPQLVEMLQEERMLKSRYEPASGLIPSPDLGMVQVPSVTNQTWYAASQGLPWQGGTLLNGFVDQKPRRKYEEPAPEHIAPYSSAVLGRKKLLEIVPGLVDKLWWEGDNLSGLGKETTYEKLKLYENEQSFHQTRDASLPYVQQALRTTTHYPNDS
jgi:hypothetical protein